MTNPDVVEGTITLHKILYSEIKMADGYNVFEEVHQAEPMGPVDVAVPNCEEAERLMLMLQKNSAAFLKFYLGLRSKIPMETIGTVLGKSMDPIPVAEIEKCNWDNKKIKKRIRKR